MLVLPSRPYNQIIRIFYLLRNGCHFLKWWPNFRIRKLSPRLHFFLSSSYRFKKIIKVALPTKFKGFMIELLCNFDVDSLFENGWSQLFKVKQLGFIS